MDGLTVCKALVLTALSLPLSAAIFTVNVTTDSVDSNTADGLCLDAAGKCSLRAAVMQANASTGVDMITLSAATYRLSITGTDEDGATQGDLDITEAVTIQGAGMTKSIIDAQQVDRVFHVIGIASGSTVAMNDLTIQNGMVATNKNGGAGILHWSSSTLDLKRVALLDNNVSGTLSGDSGGAINNLATAYVTECLFQGNSADRGGAIFSNTNLVINRSAFYQNGAKAGGALLNYGSASIINTTFSQNSATNNGGAITNNQTMSIHFCTVADNSAPIGSGGGINNAGGTVSIESSIIAYHGEYLNCKGSISSLNHNMEDANSCGLNQSADRINTDPQLELLGFYGGATPTHRLRLASPAIDAGSLNTCFPTDQRGVKRPWGRGYDIGAYEWVGPNPSVLMYLLN